MTNRKFRNNSFSRRDIYALFGLTTFFLINLILSWQRWTQPLIDHGREMNLPARILAGERLYLDVQFLYGPFTPYFNALLYRLFGIHLTTLRISGAICAILIIWLIYWLARQLMNVWEASLTSGLLIVVCAIKSTANYLQPYAYAALYGLVFSLGSLVFTVCYLKTKRPKFLFVAGLLAAMSVISKPETALPALGAAGVSWLIESFITRKILWREAIYFTLPVIGLAAAVYGYILSRVPLRILIDDNHLLFTNMPPQLIYFNREISGLDNWGESLAYTATGLGVFAIWIGYSLLIGALISRRQAGWGSAAIKGLYLINAGMALKVLLLLFFKIKSDATPLTGAAMVIPPTICLLVWRVWKRSSGSEEIALTDRILLLYAVFAMFSILRSIFNVSTSSPYTPFFIPSIIIIFLYLLFRQVPDWIAPAGVLRDRVRLIAMIMAGLMILGTSVNSIRLFRNRITYAVRTPRGTLVIEPKYGQPLEAAIKYVEQHTSPDDYVLPIPQGTMINFLTGRRYPFREEIIHPGFLAGEKEIEAIEMIKSRRVSLILPSNLLTPEFRDRIFGVEYNQVLMKWITENYRLKARFDSEYSRKMIFGDRQFFILAYELEQ